MPAAGICPERNRVSHLPFRVERLLKLDSLEGATSSAYAPETLDLFCLSTLTSRLKPIGFSPTIP